ncbi:MAG: pyridoxamine 5'-phosphate oxidase family protein [Nocardioides sp.]|uniref:pyridoxamine 5'-phosphate oxidase family protein n=1 Tax=Nocardioides sp. TaxID=35761 RepID=UPI003F0CDCE6
MTVFRPGWDALPAPLAAFYAEYQLNTLTTLRPDGRPHVVPVGVALDPEQGCAWVITRDGSRKVRNLRAAAESGTPGHVAVCQVDGPRWSTIEGRGTVLMDDASTTRAVGLYSARYGREADNGPDRAVIRIEVDRFVHGPALLG